jgi:hypothetical protein
MAKKNFWHANFFYVAQPDSKNIHACILGVGFSSPMGAKLRAKWQYRVSRVGFDLILLGNLCWLVLIIIEQ